MASSISSHESFIPIQDDPLLCRRYKKVPIYSSVGKVLRYEIPRHRTDVLPAPELVDMHKNDILTDPQVYANIIVGNENTNISMSPAVDSMSAVDTVKSALKM